MASIAGLAVLAGCASVAGQRTTHGAGSHSARPHVEAAALRRPAARPASLPRFAGGLPWPVVLQTSAGRYVIGRDGVTRRLPKVRRARVRLPADFVWVTWPAHALAIVREGHLEIVRNQKVLWRSAREYRVTTANQMNMILTSRAGIAFQVPAAGPWYRARWNGPEHLVARSGWPAAWTRSGNLVAVQGDRRHGYSFAVYSPSGALVATLATGLNTSLLDQGAADAASGTFWFIGTDQVLYRTDGVSVTRVADFTGWGATRADGAMVNVMPGGQVQMLSAHWRQGQVIFSPTGQMLARILAPRNRSAAAFGLIAASLRRRMFAFSLYNETGGGTVYLVRPGRAPIAVYRTAHGASPCAPALSWHGSWMLYLGGPPVLIHASGSHRVIRLPDALPIGGGRMARVLGVSWR